MLVLQGDEYGTEVVSMHVSPAGPSCTFCVTAVSEQQETFACAQALVHGLVLKRKQPGAAVKEGAVEKININWALSGACAACESERRRIQCARAGLVQDMVLKRKQAWPLSKRTL